MSRTRLAYGGSESQNRNLEAIREGRLRTGSVGEKLKKEIVSRQNNNNNNFDFVVTLLDKKPNDGGSSRLSQTVHITLKDLIGFFSGECNAPRYISSECLVHLSLLSLCPHTACVDLICFLPPTRTLVGPMATSPYGKGQ